MVQAVLPGTGWWSSAGWWWWWWGVKLGHPGVVADTQCRGHGWSWGREGEGERDDTGIGTGEVLRGAVGTRESLLGGAIACEPLITGRTGGWCKYLGGPSYWEDWWKGAIIPGALVTGRGGGVGGNGLRGPRYWEAWGPSYPTGLHYWED